MVDGLFLVASNELPMCSFENDAMYKTEWEPFTSRCEIVKMEEKDVKSGKTKFPYTVEILAKALLHLNEENPVEVDIENDSHQESQAKHDDEEQLILESGSESENLCGESGSSQVPHIKR